MPKQPYLTKSTFVSAPACERWLWKIFHERPPYEEPAVGSAADIGNRVGQLAMELYAGGVEVTEAPYEHDKAVQRTRGLMADTSVPAIFEAAFEYEGVRVRVDILERLSEGKWGIGEVKSAGNVRKDTKAAPLKEKYERDAAIQYFVLTGCGLDVTSVHIVHINKAYDGPVSAIDPERFFSREDVMQEVLALQGGIQGEVTRYLSILALGEAPNCEPTKKKCQNMGGGECPFWAECTANKPDDWIQALYRPHGKQLEYLVSEGNERLSELELQAGVNPVQQRMILAATNGRDEIEHKLGREIRDIPLPAIHLDFEYLAGVAMPLYEGMKPFEKIPFQYSAHRINADSSIEHIDEYLAEGKVDPRREFAERLIALLGGGNEPVIVWNAAGAEKPVLVALQGLFPDLEAPLQDIIDRLHDLAITVRENVLLRKMIGPKAFSGGVFSLKNVAPAFDEKLNYNDLEGVSHGGQAVEAFVQLVTGELSHDVDEKALRKSMLAYNERDTLCTAVVHQKLIEMGKKG